MNNKYLDWLTLISFGVGIYSLYIALENLEMNDKQNGELKEILHYLEIHLSSQDELIEDLSNHLAKQDEVLFDKQDRT